MARFREWDAAFCCSLLRPAQNFLEAHTMDGIIENLDHVLIWTRVLELIRVQRPLSPRTTDKPAYQSN